MGERVREQSIKPVDKVTEPTVPNPFDRDQDDRMAYESNQEGSRSMTIIAEQNKRDWDKYIEEQPLMGA